MESGILADERNPWTLAMLRTLMTTEPRSASEQTAYSKWFDERTDREDARGDRTHGAEGVIPLPVWIVLSWPLVRSSSTCCSSPTAPNGRSCRQR